MKFLGSYKVVPSLPKALEPLRELAFNLRWSWDHQTRALFRRLDAELWEESNHNPAKLLGAVGQERLREIASDDGFLAHMKRAHAGLKTYLSAPAWFQKKYGDESDLAIVYFSFEYGLTECLQTYSGGLGILAGDHLKSASDLGVPLVAIGVNFKEGYFQQYLTSDGWQHERYELSDFDNLPMTLVTDEEDRPIKLAVNFGDREVFFQVWKIQVGRVPLYALDARVAENSPEDQALTERLYGGDSETRIQQEIILGVGGVKLMHRLGYENYVCHMNEGHSAFMALERIRQLMDDEGLSFDEAKEVGFYSNVFTTHTPVPAGIDVFGRELVEKYFSAYYQNDLKIDKERFFSLGALENNGDAVFNMAHLAMNTAAAINGVSRLHGEVSRAMWASGFPGAPIDEIPIGHVTNGVHMKSHLSPEMTDLFVRYLGERWGEDVTSEKLWKRIEKIPDEELWRTHERRRERLVAFARRRLIKQIQDRGGAKRELEWAGEVLDPSALTIGFARRFATYKRANLIFRNYERIREILLDPDYPVQLIIAGKAHPQDDEGKEFIREIFQSANSQELRRKIVFLENYDMNVARYLVEGCDVWMNNPRRPLEASGTSGMKVIANGGLNFSVLDGWWDEAFSPDLGWKIGAGEEYDDVDYQDEIESGEMYDSLEREIVPTFYDRGVDGLPRQWIRMVKSSMKRLGPVFNTDRMVKEYFKNFYLPAHHKLKTMRDDGYRAAKDLATWKKRVAENWSKIKVVNVETPNAEQGRRFTVGEELIVQASIYLGDLEPSDVEAQLYFGPADESAGGGANRTSAMEVVKAGDEEGATHRYEGTVECSTTGAFGYTIRVLPKHDLMAHPFETKRIFWASAEDS
ncbi:MAG: alpha-glucan family phosphorylase [Ignavibacteriales bacterium]|nr:alpha-glucan family phosphorylase [Ignavibacteriales bacterium]